MTGLELIIDRICDEYIRQRVRVYRDPIAEDDPRLASLRGGTTPASRFDDGVEVHES